MVAPWGANKIVWCSDCHGSNTAGDPKGPHGSNLNNILVATTTSDATNGTPLCNVCHTQSNYWNGSIVSSRYSQHPPAKSNHRTIKGCFACHMYDYNGWGGAAGGNTKTIFIHGQNKRWYYREISGLPLGSGQYADAFVNGYLADVDFVAKKCWTEVSAGEFATNCGHTHSGTTY